MRWGPITSGLWNMGPRLRGDDSERRRRTGVQREEQTVKHCHAATLSIFTLALLALIPGVRPAAAQQDYPNRPLHVFIGFPAGSGAALPGRYFGAALQQLAGQRGG